MKPRIILFALVAAAYTTACTGKFATSVLGNPNSSCEPPAGMETVMAYPAPNSTGVPDNFGEVIFASTALLNPPYRAYVVDNTNGGTIQANFGDVSTYAWTAAIPSPAASPPFNNPYYQSSPNTGIVIPSGHNVTVYLAQQQCNPNTSLGSFTVQ
jgi:hypothetical protein